jgi:hypothetical protein
MEYSISLENVEREVAGGHRKASITYTFKISNGFVKTYGDVVLTEAGADIIELMGKDPKTAAKVALERFLQHGQDDPFEAEILLIVPLGYAEYFSKNGNYEALPVLTD